MLVYNVILVMCTKGVRYRKSCWFVNMDWFLVCFIAGVVLAVGLQLDPTVEHSRTYVISRCILCLAFYTKKSTNLDQNRIGQLHHKKQGIVQARVLGGEKTL